MEWLLIPVGVFLNWQNMRQRPLLVAAALLFYLSRAWTYIHFVPHAKRVVTFARELPSLKSPLPVERDGAQILVAGRRDAVTAYVPGPKGPVFMELIKATFGSELTTRTWETVKKCAKA